MTPDSIQAMVEHATHKALYLTSLGELHKGRVGGFKGEHGVHGHHGFMEVIHCISTIS